MTKAIRTAALIGAGLIGTGLAAATPALAQDRWDWHGGAPGDARVYRLVGRGVPALLPELRDTPRGRAFVLRNFDRNRDGYVSPREADAANRAFLAVAGPHGGRFDWDGRDRAGPPRAGPDRVVVTEEIAPLPPAFRAFHPRQTRYGATIDFGDVLCATDRADLRPAARDRLSALADFLRAHQRIRARIDGYTDSRASDAYNQRLSEARAGSVAAALGRLGLDPARFQVAGHGETDPVATNATAAGRQQNRRVEVTLIGQRADRFAR